MHHEIVIYPTWLLGFLHVFIGVGFLVSALYLGVTRNVDALVVLLFLIGLALIYTSFRDLKPIKFGESSMTFPVKMSFRSKEETLAYHEIKAMSLSIVPEKPGRDAMIPHYQLFLGNGSGGGAFIDVLKRRHAEKIVLFLEAKTGLKVTLVGERIRKNGEWRQQENVIDKD